jgi:hypothetical protein
VCGKTNHNEETGDPVYEADWAFCSSECHTAYNVTEKAAFTALGKDCELTEIYIRQEQYEPLSRLMDAAAAWGKEEEVSDGSR